MKYNKTIYLTAFLLSLFLILLLEAASLGFLAEDIKPVEKKEVEIELLLSSSNNAAKEISQTKNNNEFKETKSKLDKNAPKDKELIDEEADKSSSTEDEKKDLEKKDQFILND